MLAAWTLAGLRDIHAMNAGRTLLGGIMNAAAIVLFIAAGKVWWPQAAVMLVAAVSGGYAGARVARRVNPSRIRTAIIVVSVVVTIAFFRRISVPKNSAGAAGIRLPSWFIVPNRQ